MCQKLLVSIHYTVPICLPEQLCQIISHPDDLSHLSQHLSPPDDLQHLSPPDDLSPLLITF